MKRLVLALALLGALPANAQNMLLLGSGRAQTKVASAPAGYQGPGDVVSGALAWWGLRCYNSAYTGSIADIFDAATGSTTETLLTCSAGGIINETINPLSTTCAVSCVVKTLVDQSGANSCAAGVCNLGQGTLSAMPVFTPNCIGSLPCMTFTAASSQFLSKNTNLPTQSQPLTYSAAAFAATNANMGIGGRSDSGSSAVTLYFQTTPIAVITAGTNLSVGITVSTWYALQAVVNGASSTLYLNGSATNGNAGANTLSTASTMFIGNDGFSNFMNGKVTEFGIWSSAFNGTQQSNMNSNQRAYWGF